MMTWRRWGFGGVFTLFLMMLMAFPVYAEDLLPAAGTWEGGIRTGYTLGLRKHHRMVPVHLRLGAILFKGKPWILPPGAFEVSAEPFTSVIMSTRRGTHGDVEFGINIPTLTYYFDLGLPFYPYIEGGVGVMYTDLRGYNLGGHFSFTENAGIGASYFFTDKLAMNVSAKYRHVSNANLYEDNAGLDSALFMVGLSYFMPNP
jgi:hypothetical protein